jgi:hypothetical protein
VVVSDGDLAQVVELHFAHACQVFRITGAVPVQMFAVWAPRKARPTKVSELARGALQGVRDADADGGMLQAFARAILRGDSEAGAEDAEPAGPPDIVVQVVDAHVHPHEEENWAVARLSLSDRPHMQANAILVVATSRENSLAKVHYFGGDERLTQGHDGCFEYRPQPGVGALFRVKV